MQGLSEFLIYLLELSDGNLMSFSVLLQSPLDLIHLMIPLSLATEFLSLGHDRMHLSLEVVLDDDVLGALLEDDVL